PPPICLPSAAPRPSRRRAPSASAACRVPRSTVASWPCSSSRRVACLEQSCKRRASRAGRFHHLPYELVLAGSPEPVKAWRLLVFRVVFEMAWRVLFLFFVGELTKAAIRGHEEVGQGVVGGPVPDLHPGARPLDRALDRQASAVVGRPEGDGWLSVEQPQQGLQVQMPVAHETDASALVALAHEQGG